MYKNRVLWLLVSGLLLAGVGCGGSRQARLAAQSSPEELARALVVAYRSGDLRSAVELSPTLKETKEMFGQMHTPEGENMPSPVFPKSQGVFADSVVAGLTRGLGTGAVTWESVGYVGLVKDGEARRMGGVVDIQHYVLQMEVREGILEQGIYVWSWKGRNLLAQTEVVTVLGKR